MAYEVYDRTRSHQMAPVIDRDVVCALLEDGPHALDELAGWLEVPAEPLGAALDAIRVPACERCHRRFLPTPNTAGRFCSRACYAPNPGPSHEKKAVDSPRGPTGTSTQRLGENHAPLYPAATIDALLEEDNEDDELVDIDEGGAPRADVQTRSAEPSWWVLAPRDPEGFAAAARAHRERLMKSKTAQRMTVRTLP